MAIALFFEPPLPAPVPMAMLSEPVTSLPASRPLAMLLEPTTALPLRAPLAWLLAPRTPCRRRSRSPGCWRRHEVA